MVYVTLERYRYESRKFHNLFTNIKPLQINIKLQRNNGVLIFIGITTIQQIQHVKIWAPPLLFLVFFWSGLQGPKAYSLWYGVVPKPSIG